MPRFFFDVDDGVCPTRDRDGQTFPDQQAASQEATGLLADIAKDQAMKGMCNDITVDLKSENGHVVFTATLSVKARWVSWKEASAQPDAQPRRQRHPDGLELPPAAVGNGQGEPGVQATTNPFAPDMIAAKVQGTINRPNLRQAAH